MAETVNGIGVVWGLDYAQSGVVVSAAAGNPQDATFSRQSDVQDIRNGQGVTQGRVYFNHSHTWSGTIIPSDITTPTIAGAVTAMDAMLPAPGTILTLTDAISTVTDGTNSGKYMVDTASLRYTNQGAAVIEFSATQFVDNDVAVAVT